MLEAIGAGSSKAVGKRDWADIWLESPQFAKVKEEIAELKRAGTDSSLSEGKGHGDCKLETPFRLRDRKTDTRFSLANRRYLLLPSTSRCQWPYFHCFLPFT